MKKHTVKKGDTIWGLSREYKVSMSEIINANPQLKNADKLSIGMSLNIPIPKGSKHYESIGRAYETALKDVQNLPSVKAMLKLLR